MSAINNIDEFKSWIQLEKSIRLINPMATFTPIPNGGKNLHSAVIGEYKIKKITDKTMDLMPIGSSNPNSKIMIHFDAFNVFEKNYDFRYSLWNYESFVSGGFGNMTETRVMIMEDLIYDEPIEPSKSIVLRFVHKNGKSYDYSQGGGRDISFNFNMDLISGTGVTVIEPTPNSIFRSYRMEVSGISSIVLNSHQYNEISYWAENNYGERFGGSTYFLNIGINVYRNGTTTHYTLDGSGATAKIVSFEVGDILTFTYSWQNASRGYDTWVDYVDIKNLVVNFNEI